jgi:hypothetical protein
MVSISVDEGPIWRLANAVMSKIVTIGDQSKFEFFKNPWPIEQTPPWPQRVGKRWIPDLARV